MTKFFLNIRDGETLTRDPRPYRFSNAQVARDAAIQAVRDFLGTHPGAEMFNEKRIEIADETGHPIAIVDAQDVHPMAPDIDSFITG